MKRIDQDTFRQVKRMTRLHRTSTIVRRTGLHNSTVLNIRGCKNYGEYREMVQAEHPPVKYSLADDVLEIHRRLFEKPTVAYIPPKTAQQAMQEIKKEVN